jgi:hypothetical protein
MLWMLEDCIICKNLEMVSVSYESVDQSSTTFQELLI